MPNEAGIKLRDDAEKAHIRYDACMKEFLHRVNQFPSLPKPDGSLTVRIVAQDLKDAIDAYTTAQEKLTAFLDLHPEERSSPKPR